MHSPPVQPISASSSGTGSVRTMCEEATEKPVVKRAVATLGGAADRQHRAGGADRAGGGPGLTPSSPSRSERTAEPSWISTPCARRRSRRPSASRAGCTVAEVGQTAPPRKAGEAQRAATSAAESSCSACGDPSSRQAATASSQTPSWAAAVETCR